MDTIISYYGDLIHKLKYKTNAHIVYTSMLSRLCDHDKTVNKINKINLELCIHLYHVCVAFTYWNLFFLFSGSWHPEHGAVPLSESILGLYILRVDLFSPSLPLWVLKREIILWIREGIFSNKHLVYTTRLLFHQFLAAFRLGGLFGQNIDIYIDVICII